MSRVRRIGRSSTVNFPRLLRYHPAERSALTFTGGGGRCFSTARLVKRRKVVRRVKPSSKIANIKRVSEMDEDDNNDDRDWDDYSGQSSKSFNQNKLRQSSYNKSDEIGMDDDDELRFQMEDELSEDSDNERVHSSRSRRTNRTRGSRLTMMMDSDQSDEDEHHHLMDPESVEFVEMVRSKLNGSSQSQMIKDNDEEHNDDDDENDALDKDIVDSAVVDKPPPIRKKISALGEYIYGPNVVLSAMKAACLPSMDSSNVGGQREFFHRLFLLKSFEKHISMDPSSESVSVSRNVSLTLELLNLAQKLDIPVEFCEKRELNAMVGRNIHQGFILDCDPLNAPVFDDQMESGNDECLGLQRMREQMKLSQNETRIIWMAMDSCVNEYNVGSMVRSGLFFSVGGVIHPIRHSAPLSPLTAHSAAGALDAMRSRLFRTADLLCPTLKSIRMAFPDSVAIVGLCAPNDNDDSQGVPIVEIGELKKLLSEEEEKKKEGIKLVVLVVGNESKGLSRPVREQCTHLACIQPDPQATSDLAYSGVDSLNVSAAVTTALYSLQ